MNIEKEYQYHKEQNKENYRLVHVEDKDYEYCIEYRDETTNAWYKMYIIDYRKCGIIDFLLQRFSTYEEQAKKEFIGHMIVLNKKENKSIV
jgi:hypothetical protein